MRVGFQRRGDSVKAAAFEYHAPTSVAEAIEKLGALGEDAKLLAGGQSLIPILALRLSRFAHLIDLGRVAELRGITQPGGALRIGAMTTQAAALRSPEVARAQPLVARAVKLVGHFQIRNRGTLGGSIAHADPAAEAPAVALALDAELEIAGPEGARRVPARDFFVSTWTTAVAANEVLTAIHFPARAPRSGFAIEEVARRCGDFALAGAACAVALDELGAVASVRIALLGLAPAARRAERAEAALRGARAGAVDLAAIGRAACDDMEPNDDVHASADYRRRVGAHLVERALAKALEEAARA
jgi:carbon-monoxide dehydrogenase medium subunit